MTGNPIFNAAPRAIFVSSTRAAYPARTAVLLVLLALVLGGCATRPGPELLVPTAAPVADLEQVQVFAMTDRAPMGADSLAFGSDRGEPVFEAFTIGVSALPSTAISGSRALNSDRDLSKDFVTLERKQVDAASFGSLVARHARGDDDRIVVFVHGYNYNYQEAVFQLAELSADREAVTVPVLFSWPSQASVRGYVADRDAATYARDDLAGLLATLTASAGNRRIVVVGHSMGAWLVMETIRQLRLQGRHSVVERLQVGLAAPDIDVDVFRTQMAVVGRLSPPLTVLVSADDRALALSRRIAEGRPRLGSISVDDPRIIQLVSYTGISVVDIANLPAGDSFNHNRFMTLAVLGSSIDQRGGALQIQRAGAYILDASGAILSIPFRSMEAHAASR